MRQVLAAREITHETPFCEFVKKHKRHAAYVDMVALQHPNLLAHAAIMNSGQLPSQVVENPPTPWNSQQIRSRCDRFDNFYQGSGDAAQLALIGGSQPRELYKDVLSQEEKLVSSKIKPAFKGFMRENPHVIFADRSFEHFKNTLEPDFKAFKDFSDHEKVLTHEYYLSRLRQREKEK